MGVVFAVLALLALSIKVLGMFDRDPVADPETPGSVSAPAATSAGASASASAPNGEITGQQVAAIAVALALSEPKAASISSSPGPISTGLSTGSWLQSGRMRSLGAAPSTKGRRGQ